MGFGKIFEGEYLATKNNRICKFLNKRFNGIHVGDTYIPTSTKLPHATSIVIGEGVKLGENVVILQNVTIGHKIQKKCDVEWGDPSRECPIIGDNVVIWPNSIIVGKIKIGKNSVIGAGSFIDKDIPENSIVYQKRETIIRKRDFTN